MNKREQIERNADRVRDELMVTLRELDRRRTRATDVGYQAKQHRGAIALAGIAVVGAMAAAFGYTAYRARATERHRTRNRFLALRRAWRHPDRVAAHAEDRPPLVALGIKLGMAFGLAFGTQLAKRTAQSLLPMQSAG
jgi:hypothetical protein